MLQGRRHILHYARPHYHHDLTT